MVNQEMRKTNTGQMKPHVAALEVYQCSGTKTKNNLGIYFYLALLLPNVAKFKIR